MLRLFFDLLNRKNNHICFFIPIHRTLTLVLMIFLDMQPQNILNK